MSDVMDERIKTIMELVDAHATDARIGGDRYRERIRDALKVWQLGGEDVNGPLGETPADYALQDQLMAAIEHLIADPDESLTFRRAEEGGLQIVWGREARSGHSRQTLRHHAMTYGRYRAGPAAGLAADLEGMRRQLIDADLMGDDA